MMYVYCVKESDKNIKKNIIDNKLAVAINEDYLLSKNEELCIDGVTIKYNYTLDKYITMFDKLEVFVFGRIKITMSESIQILLNDLYKPYNEDEMSYADIIYCSDNPYMEIKNIINRFLLVRVDEIMRELQKQFNILKKDFEDGIVRWKQY